MATLPTSLMLEMFRPGSVARLIAVSTSFRTIHRRPVFKHILHARMHDNHLVSHPIWFDCVMVVLTAQSTDVHESVMSTSLKDICHS